ncbi:MAG: prolyl oligopeptidase family serine peptidase [Chthoniobacter sp.]|uniref:prolyl oligopeptidase family serine peptidase n=1 Tax=Chthoniobacter sp. TaxID=2510640 RepID=UPI0032A7A283
MLKYLLPVVLAAVSAAALAGGSAEDYERALNLATRTTNKVYRASFDAHWLPGNQQFWYRVQTGPDAWEYALVDAASGATQRAPDAAALGLPKQVLKTSEAATQKAHPSRKGGVETRIRFLNHTTETVDVSWIDPQGNSKTYGHIKAGDEMAQNTFAGHVWLIVDAMGGTLAVLEAKAEPLEIVIDGKGTAREAGDEPEHPRDGGLSPDGRWEARCENHNVVLRQIANGETAALTKDGTADREYRGPIAWAPDSQSFVVTSVAKVSQRQVTIVESSPGDQVQPKVITYPYTKPGDPLPNPRPVLVRMHGRNVSLIDNALFPTPFTESLSVKVRWSPRSNEFYFDYNQRGHQLYRIIGVAAATGAPRVVVEEKSDNFIDYTHKTWRHWLDQTGELLWMSERDGWCRLYLYDAATGTAKGVATRERGVVREIEKMDEQKRVVWFLGSGLRADEDPYHLHLCRVGFDGTGFVQLTKGDGNHEVTFSPDGRYFIDRWSRVDQVPVAELRRSDSGALVCELEHADAQALLGAGWTMPERFTAKGRDGKTDIFGIIIKPSNFDPARKYPVLEEVYAGPHGAFVPKTFGRLLRQHMLAELGFIVVQADGMGTNHRGKAFHDVAWKNLKDAGFPDRIAWIRSAATTRPWMDLGHVGIYGGSAGGQSAMRALIDHADFYQAAFADCGCHDNRMDKIWWNEQWLGWPVDDSYIRNSNVADASKVKGALMLCFGEVDHNVDPATTMQVVNALEKADKDFELLVMTGTGHGAAETPYGGRRRMDFLVRHLLGVEPRHP